jgi:hypothetical protein
MSTTNEMLELEEHGWKALSSDGEAATDFYDRVLDDEVVMLLPGGLLLSDRLEILKSMSGTPWSSYRIDDARILSPTDGIRVVVYRVDAKREGSPDYSALIASTYVRREAGWRMILHQQTPA